MPAGWTSLQATESRKLPITAVAQRRTIAWPSPAPARPGGGTCLDRLAAEGIIAPCDPGIAAARIKHADRRPQGQDLDLSLIRMT